MTKAVVSKILVTVITVAGFFASSFASASDLPTGNDPNSNYVIRYDDLNLILSASVMDVGPSDRRPAGRTGNRNTMTKISHGNKSVSAFEGNRVLFHEFAENHVENLLAIRKDLETVPDFIPLEQFDEYEQLAYWFNLHNVAVMHEVAKAYPVKKLKNLVSGRNSVWDKKTMSIDGVPTSIQDIENHVVENWNNPLVLYGFFMGSIGGPNIRTTAYTGDNLVEALQENAVRFVNSLRGFRLWSGAGRVSDHYKIGLRYFPNFEEDIKKHLLGYAGPSAKNDILKAKSFKLKNYDWGIADLKNGSVYAGGSFNTNPGALAWFLEAPDPQAGGPFGPPPGTMAGITTGLGKDATFMAPGSTSISPQTKALLRAMKLRNQRRIQEGEVTVEEFVGDEGSRITTRDAFDGPADDTSEPADGGGIIAE